MRKSSFYLLSLICLILCSWKAPLNTNSWSIRIGKNEVLASWKNNKMGDTARLDLKKLNPDDTLFAGQHLCGSSAKGALVTLTLKNERNEIIAKTSNRESQWDFAAAMPLKGILTSPDLRPGQTLRVFFSIEWEQKEKPQTDMLGVLLLN